MFEKFVSGNFRLLNNAVSEGEDISVFGLNLGEKLALLEDSAFLFFVVENEDEILEVANKLEMLGRTCEYMTNVITPNSSEFEAYEKNLSILNKIANGDINTLIITP